MQLNNVRSLFRLYSKYLNTVDRAIVISQQSYSKCNNNATTMQQSV